MAPKVRGAYWSIDNSNKLSVDQIITTLYSHVFCAFADIDVTFFTVVINPNYQLPFQNFNQVLHGKNPPVKTLLSIGGGGKPDQVQAFATMASDPASRQTFINSSILVARQYGFDGLDLDYEFPKTQDDMDNLGALLGEWRTAVQAESSTAPLLLTAAVIYKSTNYENPPIKYPTDSIAKNLDWINIMAYDFSSPADWGSPHLTQPTAQLNNRGRNGVESWEMDGVPRSKIVLGVPFYGYAWKLADGTVHGYDAPAIGPTGAYGLNGVLYNTIMGLNPLNHEWKTDNNLVANYCYSTGGDNTWISYDGVEAVAGRAGPEGVRGEQPLRASKFYGPPISKPM